MEQSDEPAQQTADWQDPEAEGIAQFNAKLRGVSCHQNHPIHFVRRLHHQPTRAFAAVSIGAQLP
ncbi:MAG: hypothetical protein H6815_12105 [Phycisphaeraceae bacterium]|nr:hypothetical protein [Phycisphaerales bacterium]MCB9861183.1 hypothetical protein [Phycisphaeraceae bacterium]